jgi:glutathione synthase/RimK-type ligase-like ATP-grasp enzyme
MILIGQADHRRTRYLLAAAESRRPGLAAAVDVIDWSELLRDPNAVVARLRAHAQEGAKIDSPGDSTPLRDALIRHGWRCEGERGAPPAPLAHGEFAHQSLWFSGFADLLRRLEAASPDILWFNAPHEILAMCDKLACQRRLDAIGAPTPALFGPVEGYAELRERMDAAGADRAFLKARYGSSAAGVVAYRRNRDGRECAYTSAELVRENGKVRLFNTLRPKRYDDARDIAALIDAIAMQGAYAEAWVSKPRTVGGAHFDLRVVSVGGEPRQWVARVAAHPMTNLHLGNRRVAIDEVLDHETKRRVVRAVRNAAVAFRCAGSIGFDLIPTREHVVVIEANAFGDLLPGATAWDGAGTYDDQASWIGRRVRMSALTKERVAHG